MNRKPNTFRKLVSVALMLTVGSFSTLLTGAAFAQTAQKAAGELSVRGNVTLNGVNAISGATVFSNGTVRTADNGSATVNLGKLGRIELAPNSEMVMSFADNNIGGTLRSGRATVSTPAGVGISVVTADGNAVADGAQAAVLVVDVTCGNTRVAATRSGARVTSGSKVEYVAAGQEVAVGTQSQTTGSRCTRLAATAAAASGAGAGLSAGAIAALIIAGVGGAVAGIVAASQSDSTSATGIIVSSFRP
ncbi:MAG TPA: hypothetical protein VFD58_16375 [Blastocatellia bacterium]|nr:hypothetical protein [Blastocatellia bacterium]